MSFYDDMAAVSLDLLTEYGQTVTRRAVTVGAYDPATGVSTPTTADTSRKGAAFPFGAGVTVIRGEMVKANDIQLLLDAEGPALFNDRFLVGGVEYSVVSIAETSPAGTPVLFDLHLRAGA